MNVAIFELHSTLASFSDKGPANGIQMGWTLVLEVLGVGTRIVLPPLNEDMAPGHKLFVGEWTRPVGDFCSVGSRLHAPSFIPGVHAENPEIASLVGPEGSNPWVVHLDD